VFQEERQTILLDLLGSSNRFITEVVTWKVHIKLVLSPS